eukprot:TRINITY_DN10688_c0_g1_i7.p1 TRINITY_DN10688_c0_g1~~TRINITY_DN10688_c0_g1_i7.p1  ORF type:complete len:415 (+),score=78.03 TRINITY_DN10688_c0_g1_i7:88-1332(+)
MKASMVLAVALITIFSSLSVYASPEEDKVVVLPLRNMKNLRYFARLFVGSDRQTVLHGVINLEQPNILIQSEECKTCLHNRHDCQGTTSCKEKQEDSQKQLNISGVSMLCSAIEEDFSLSRKLPLFRSESFAINNILKKENKLAESDEAYIGFAPSSNGEKSILDQLFEDQVISKRVFALALADNSNSNFNEDSLLWLGGFNKSLLKEGSQMKYYEVADDSSWSLKSNKLTVGSDANTFTVERTHLAPDNEAIIIPHEALNSVLSQIQNVTGTPCFSQENVYYHCGCAQNQSAKFPAIHLQMNKDDDIVVLPEHYVTRTWSGCQVYLRGTTENVAKLGLPFMRRFLTVFDAESKVVGLGDVQDNSYDDDLIALLIFPITIIMFAIGVCAIIYLKSNAKKAHRNEYQQIGTRNLA